MNYNRVIPRDLFNEAKLLKCIGRLCLLIHDNMTPSNVIINVEHYNSYSGFQINQNSSDGSIMVNNLDFEYNKKKLFFYTILNSKENFPLYVTDVNNEDTSVVFDENGIWHEDFIQFLKSIK